MVVTQTISTTKGNRKVYYLEKNEYEQFKAYQRLIQRLIRDNYTHITTLRDLLENDIRFLFDHITEIIKDRYEEKLIKIGVELGNQEKSFRKYDLQQKIIENRFTWHIFDIIWSNWMKHKAIINRGSGWYRFNVKSGNTK